MHQRFLAILLVGLLPAAAWAAQAATDAVDRGAVVQQTRQAHRSQVTDLPYSATQTVTIVRLLADGDAFARQTVTRLYRDSAGRTRRDVLDSEGELDHSVITGPDGATIFLDHQNALVSAAGAKGPAGMFQGASADPPASTAGRAGTAVEQLGQRDIEGVAATGRITRSQVGKDGENIEVTSETWYSEELKMLLYRKHSDPRLGESTTEISDLDRSEPDPALFEVPQDYQLLTSHFRKN